MGVHLLTYLDRRRGKTMREKVGNQDQEWTEKNFQRHISECHITL